MTLFDELQASVGKMLEAWEADRDLKIAEVRAELTLVQEDRDRIATALATSEDDLTISAAEVARLTATVDQLETRIRELDQAAPGARDRSKMVVGVDMPGADTTGPRPGTVFEDVEAPRGQGHIVITTPGPTRGKRFWCSVRFADGVEGWLEDCLVHGPDPDLITGGLVGGIFHAAGSSGYKKKHITIRHTKLDPSPWITERGRKKLSPYTAGIHGGDYTLEWCEIVNWQDGLNINHPGDSLAIAGSVHTTIRFNWIHKGFYVTPYATTSDGQPHCDAIQTNGGRNILIEGNLLGGRRDIVGYNSLPGYNSGDDFCNAVLMLKQEVAGEASRTVVTVRKNWLGGGVSSVNWAYNTAAGKTNDWADSEFTDNRFLERLPGWGTRNSSKDSGKTYYTATTNPPAGFYFSVFPQIKARITGNVIHETGQPVIR